MQDFPSKWIYEPWKAPKKVQEEAGCIIGVDYPAPIVDHAVVHKVNIQRIKVLPLPTLKPSISSRLSLH